MSTIPKAPPTANIGSVSIQYAGDGSKFPEQPIRTELTAGLCRCISRLVGPRSNVKLLDLGCGTGLFTIPLAKQLGYQTTGADCSTAMLNFASHKPSGDLVRWDRQEATALNYDDESFDVVFMSNLLDLIKSPHDVVRECSRVLKPGGVLVYHFGALEDILSDPEHKFFPETVELDHMRTPARKQVETWFRQADLKDVASDRDTYRLWKTAQERLSYVEEKSNVVLHMLTFDAFNKGLSKMRSYVASNPMDPWLRELTVTTTYGQK